MDDREKWRMLSCTVGAQDKSVINRVMLRFRPIAPKPVAGVAGSGGVQFDNKSLLVSKPRSKRRYVRKNNGCRQKKKTLSSDLDSNLDENKVSDVRNEEETIVTLQFFPEKTESMDASGNLEHFVENNNNNTSNNREISSEDRENCEQRVIRFDSDNPELDLALLMSSKRVAAVESWVTVESVTDKCMDAKELGSTDVERMMNLEADTCPGFISDGLNNVQWMNTAYKRMVAVTGENDNLPPATAGVYLVIKEELPRFCSVFSCKVKLQCAWKEKEKETKKEEKWGKTVPCDVWRMDCGGFAWRLDVEAALSLGR